MRQWGLVLAQYGVTQFLIQALTALAGIAIIHTLSKSEYALFAIATSMQSTCNLLADLGIGIAMRSIGGRVWTNRARFGELMNTALALRHRFALSSFVICIPVTAWMLTRNNASALYTVALCAAVAAGTLPLLSSTIYGISPLFHGEFRRLQKLELANVALRLTFVGALILVGINAWLACLVGAATNWLRAKTLRLWAEENVDFKAPLNSEDRDQMLGIAVKSLPNTLFFCFQGQLTILILAFTGNSHGIADVTALGRLAAILAVLSAIVINILTPRFARCQDLSRLPKLYLLVLSGSFLALTPLAVLAWFLPKPLLWILGHQYAALGTELGWIVGAACISQFAAVLWSLNSSKAWIRIQVIAYIPLLLTTQVIAGSLLDLREFQDLLIFNMVTAASPIPIYIADAIIGLQHKR